MTADDFDLDAILKRVSADTLREMEATTDMDAKLAAVISGAVPGSDEPPTDNPELAVLEASCFDTYIDRTDEQVNFDVVTAVKAAVRDGLIRADFDHSEFGWRLTEAGEKRLADLWGSDRVPPNKGGHVSCSDHDVYVVAPGDPWACPECPTTAEQPTAQQPTHVDPGTIDGHPGLNWYTTVEKVHGRDLKPGQWLDSLDHSGARTIHHITDLTADSRLVSFSNINGDSEVVRADVEYDVVDPDSQVAPDGTPVGGIGPRPPRGDNPDVCIRCRVAPSRNAWGCCVTCGMAEAMDVPVSALHGLLGDTRTDEQVLRDLAADPVIGGAMVLADAEAQRLAVEPNIRAFEASRRRRKMLRQLAFIAAVAVVALLAFVAIGRL